MRSYTGGYKARQLSQDYKNETDDVKRFSLKYHSRVRFQASNTFQSAFDDLHALTPPP